MNDKKKKPGIKSNDSRFAGKIDKKKPRPGKKKTSSESSSSFKKASPDKSSGFIKTGYPKRDDNNFSSKPNTFTRKPFTEKIEPSEPIDPNAPVRLAKIMSERAMCSRREAISLIEQGYVFVNGERIEETGNKFDRDIKIQISSPGRKILAQKYTVIVNKPVGYVSHADDDKKYPTVASLITDSRQMPFTAGVKDAKDLIQGLAPAGRLDIDSKGLIVLTQNGVVAKQLIGEYTDVTKEYVVKVKGHILENGIELLNHGLSLDGKKLKPAEVDWMGNNVLKFVLREGKKRQIRRMCELVGLKVISLRRVRIGRVKIGKLKEGYWRILEPHEKF